MRRRLPSRWRTWPDKPEALPHIRAGPDIAGPFSGKADSEDRERFMPPQYFRLESPETSNSSP